jgi:hypothetical protein
MFIINTFCCYDTYVNSRVGHASHMFIYPLSLHCKYSSTNLQSTCNTFPVVIRSDVHIEVVTELTNINPLRASGNYINHLL